MTINGKPFRPLHHYCTVSAAKLVNGYGNKILQTVDPVSDKNKRVQLFVVSVALCLVTLLLLEKQCVLFLLDGQWSF